MKILGIIFYLVVSIEFTQACEKKSLHGRVWSSQYVTYSFVESTYLEKNKNNIKIQPLGSEIKGISKSEARKLCRQATKTWNLFSGIKLIEVKDSINVHIRIGETDLSGHQAGFAHFPGCRSLNGDIHIDNSNRTWTKELFYKIILHEMGHSLGMVHNKNPESIMYRHITNVKKPHAVDIAHLQSLYGPPAVETARIGHSIKWHTRQFNNKCIPYYQAKVVNSESIHGEVIEVLIQKEITPDHFIVKTVSRQLSNLGHHTFTQSKGWKSFCANAKDNKNASMMITSPPFVATSMSQFVIERSFIFHNTEQVEYLISENGGKSFKLLKRESATSNLHSHQSKAVKKSGKVSFNLNNYEGKEVLVAVRYKNKGLYWNSTNHGLQIQSLKLNDVLAYATEHYFKLDIAENNTFINDNFTGLLVGVSFSNKITWSPIETFQSEKALAKR